GLGSGVVEGGWGPPPRPKAYKRPVDERGSRRRILLRGAKAGFESDEAVAKGWCQNTPCSQAERVVHASGLLDAEGWPRKASRPPSHPPPARLDRSRSALTAGRFLPEDERKSFPPSNPDDFLWRGSPTAKHDPCLFKRFDGVVRDAGTQSSAGGV
ncbi:unnamed protein product, partial [Hapterophycus canaliculatus]